MGISLLKALEPRRMSRDIVNTRYCNNHKTGIKQRNETFICHMDIICNLVVEMDKNAYLRHEGVFRHDGIKSLYKALLNIFDCYGINSDSRGNLKTDFEDFDNEIRSIGEEQGSMDYTGRFDKFDLITCHLAIDAYNAFEKRVGIETATRLYDAVISGRHDVLKEFVENKEC